MTTAEITTQAHDSTPETTLTLSTVELDAVGPIGAIRLNRPHAHNAFTRELMLDLLAAADWFNDRPAVKVVVVSGNGPSFCSGFDLRFFSSAPTVEDVRENVELGRRMAEAIAQMNATTIAAVHGHCIGGGIVLMAACDFRYASNDAAFRLPEAEIGIPLAWGGIPWLTREIGPLLTTELVLLCESVSADAALQMRMINGVMEKHELHAYVQGRAQKLSALSTLVLRATKKQVAAARDNLASNGNSFCDAHVLYSALLDKESAQSRENYLARKGYQ
jgi:enoyl-CoA hydratase/carnithine racemase